MPTKTIRRGGATGAIVFAVGFLANLLVFTRNFDDAEDVARYLDDSKLLIFLGAVSVGIAGLGFLSFLTQVRAILSYQEGTPGRLSALFFGAGILFVGLWWASAPIDVGVAATIGSGLDHSIYQTLRDIAHWQFAFSQLALAAALSSIYIVARSTGTIPKWAVRLTAVTALTALLYIVATPIVLLVPVWAIVMAIAILRIPESALPTTG